jgi:uracil-DNA glycosylase
MNPSWQGIVTPEFEKDYFKKIVEYVKKERLTKTIYPEPRNLFRCFSECDYDNLKVVIIGQDPYHDGSANGLCFSVNEESLKIPPSLRIILNAIESSVYGGLQLDKNPDLTRWSNQGILLINKVLTVEKSKANSHANIGWELFTQNIITKIDNNKTDIIFLLMGKNAQSLKIENNKVFKIEHPAASVYSGREWKFDDVFNKINDYLSSLNKEKIVW